VTPEVIIDISLNLRKFCMFNYIFVAFALCAVLAPAQTPNRPLTFDVASIKPAAPQQPGRMMMGTRGGPGTPDPGQVSFMNMPLSRIIMNAYDVKSFQVTGPSWLDSDRFDITAKIPEGATKEQFHVMLQNLLAERFKLVVHKEKKEVPIYALTVARGGLKIKESPKDVPAEGGDAGSPPPPPPGPPVMGRDGMPRMAPGRRGEIIAFGPNGFRMQGAHETMATLADVLSNQLGRPVVDMTGLTAEYDYTLNFSPEGLPGMRGMPMPMGPPPGAAPEGGHDAETGPSIFTALQEQLGLKLDSRKGPVDLIVVDSVEKTPTEN
jgi:uncharacterized protein (TIGR03435 family)